MRAYLACLAILPLLHPCFAAEFDPSLQGVRFFAYQLQNFDSPEGLQKLADSHYDMLVIDQTRSIKGSEDYDSAADVACLRATTGSSVNPKKVVCYLDPGQAEDFRWYWQDGWGVGNPAWILASDPDWPGDYPVKFWDPEWKALMKQDLAMIIADGYDGAYLDWMEIYSFEPLVLAAEAEGRDPREELFAFIRELRDCARSLKPDFFFIAQNAAELGAYREWLNLFSGIGQEDVWFTWGDDSPGDVPQDPDLTAEILSNLALWKAAGKVVFDIEYAQLPANTTAAYANGKARGFITYATLKELDQITDTPPTDYKVYNLTNGTWDIIDGPVFSPDGQWIAFSVVGKGIIYKMKPDGTSVQILIQDPEHDFETTAGSSWNAATDRLCFTAWHDNQPDIWSIRSDGSDLQQITQGPGKNKHATYSPDGRWIVFESDRDGYMHIYKMNLESGETIRITDFPNEEWDPQWAPAGNHISFTSGHDLWVMNDQGGSLHLIDEVSWFMDIRPNSFSSDGKWLIYEIGGGDATDQRNCIILVSLQTSSIKYKLTQCKFGQWISMASISPDNKTLVLRSYYDRSTDLWTLPIYLPPASPHERPVERP